MLLYSLLRLPIVEMNGVSYTEFNGRFSKNLKPRLERAADKSGVKHELEEDLEGGTLILLVETGKEEDFWKVFR